MPQLLGAQDPTPCPITLVKLGDAKQVQIRIKRERGNQGLIIIRAVLRHV